MTLLAHLSDLHLDGSERAAARAESVMAYLTGLAVPVDALLVTGDIADNGLDAEYAQARDLLGNRYPLLTCPGNHDVRPAFRRSLLGTAPSDEPVDSVRDLGGLTVAMCDSSIPGRPDGYLDDRTLEWLDEVLADAPALVAFHHPPVPLHVPSADAIRQHGEDRLAAVLDRHPQVLALLCGHAHTPAAATFADRPVLVAPGVASRLRLPWEGAGGLDGSAPAGLALHVVEDGRVTTHFRFVP